MDNTKIFKIFHESDLENVAQHVISALDKAHLIFLKGDLGAGKTRLVAEILRLYSGFLEVTSPTFNILNIYENNNHRVFHYDLYRIKNFEEIFELGISDAIENDIVLIEWPEIVEDFLREEKKIILEIALMEDGQREIQCKLL